MRRIDGQILARDGEAAHYELPDQLRASERSALPALPSLLARWLPGGRIAGAEYTAINPRRADRHPGSFKVNLRTGRWADFAIENVRGGDVVSLAAYLGNIRQVEAAQRLAVMLGLEVRDAR